MTLAIGSSCLSIEGYQCVKLPAELASIGQTSCTKGELRLAIIELNGSQATAQA